jgi:hypothetical protein
MGEKVLQELVGSSMTIIISIFICLTPCVLSNVPHTSPPDAKTSVISTTPEATTGDLLQWKPGNLPFDAPSDVRWQNLTTSAPTAASPDHESKGTMRYAVATFDFHHVATPYIISLWIIIVGLAKIGKHAVCFVRGCCSVL